MSFLNKKIIDFSDEIFGLDISDMSIKVVQLKKRKDSLFVGNYNYVDIPKDVISGGEIVKKDVLVSKIREAVENSIPKKIKNKKVACSLPESKSFLRIISMPKISEDEMREAIRWEIEGNIPLPLDKVYYDWQILDKKIQTSDNDKVDVLVLASAKTVANQFIEVIESAGLEVVNLEVESIAQARSLVKEDGDKQTNLIVDLGKGGINLLFTKGSVPTFTSSISISLSSFGEVISKEFGVSMEEAEKIKIKSGIGLNDDDGRIFNALSPILNNIASEIKKSAAFYVEGLKYAEKIDRVIVCGGGANLKGLVSYLSRELEAEIVVGDPSINFNTDKLPTISKEEIVKYATAIGLAMNGGIID